MAEIKLVTGGARSGKSAYAQKCAEQLEGKKLYIATCPKIDSEIEARIEKHRQDRAGKGWRTVEEEINLSAAIKDNPQYEIILVDCLTLWINNVMYAKEHSHNQISEVQIIDLCEELMKVSIDHSGHIFFVTNEIGSGIVPDNSAARLYRDLVGRCNQGIAQKATEVTLVCCGIPLTIKSTT